MRVRFRSAGALCATAVLTIALLLVSASAALAVPAPDHLSLVDLTAKINAAPNHRVPGYFRTVLWGSEVSTIPCDVLGVTGGPTSNSALIIFEASGPDIDHLGGIAAGMSGSPIYVEDGGADKIVGAVSYGDFETLGGTGLATPIDSMVQIQTNFAPTFKTLSRPVLTSTGVISKVIVASKPQEFYAGAAQQGTLVAKPLKSVFIGGLKPSSRPYQALAKDLASKGVDIVSLAAPLSGTPPFVGSSDAADFVAGSSVVALAARGDMWVGGLGTVTYAAGDDVVAFGHPAFDLGATDLYMLNGVVDGLWPSRSQPYKIGRPTALRGTITQDRGAGILGQIDLFPKDTRITAEATNAETGETTSSTAFMPRTLINSGTIDPMMVASATYMAGAQLFDQSNVPGSAEITTTVLVGDGSQVYTVSMRNVVDDDFDVPSMVIEDAYQAVASLQGVLYDGIEPLDILSVDVESKISPTRRYADMTDVNLVSPLKIGDNRVKISVLAYGLSATQTIDATLTVPAGTPLNGTIEVGSASDYMGDSLSYDDSTPVAATVSNRWTIADTVAELNGRLPGNDLIVTFQPRPMPIDYSSDSSDEEDDSFLSGPIGPLPSIDTSAVTDWIVSGDERVSITQLTAEAFSPAVSPLGSTLLMCQLTGPETTSTVEVYATTAGGTETLVRTAIAKPVMYGYGVLLAVIPTGRLSANTTFRVHYAGSYGWTPTDAIVRVGVRANVRLTASSKSVKYGKSVTLKATVSPAKAAGGTVIFEYYNRGWKRIATKTLNGSSAASCSWKPLKGKHNVRVRYLGGTNNSANASSQIAITAK